MNLRRILAIVLLAACGLSFGWSGEGYLASTAAAEAHGDMLIDSVAARWYYRARRGGLFKRSTPRGHHNRQTLQPNQLA